MYQAPEYDQEDAENSGSTETVVTLTEKEKAADDSVRAAIAEEEKSIPYIPSSKNPYSLGADVPTSMLSATFSAQTKVIEDIGPFDDYVQQKLGYSSKIAMMGVLAAEQIDAVAMAIYQFERGNGFILADMAGIGKGRVCAAILRYAYQAGYIPMFITEKASLFSDNYRDIKNIDGFGLLGGGERLLPNPFIVNGRKPPRKEEQEDAEGNKTHFNGVPETAIIDVDGNGDILNNMQGDPMIGLSNTKKKGQKVSDLEAAFLSLELPDDFHYAVATYSQFSQATQEGREDASRKTWLTALAHKMVFVLDECHNISGNGTAKTFFSEILPQSKGVLFSSATFAKTASNMAIYADKTDMKLSALSSRQLIEVVNESGELFQEYLATCITKCGQLIRRERNFKHCTVEYDWMPEANTADIYQKYDSTVTMFVDILKFLNSSNFADAKNKAIQRWVDSLKISPRPVIVRRPRLRGAKMQEWKSENHGSWTVTFGVGSLGNRFHFIESLLFALKADYTAKKAIDQYLNYDHQNMNVDGTEYKSNRKPIITVRSTSENVWRNLGFVEGDIIPENDFGMLFPTMLRKAIEGDIFMEEVHYRDKGKVVTNNDVKWAIQPSDFPDSGNKFRELLQACESIRLQIPISPIDHILHTIRSVERPERDLFRPRKTLVCSEVTGRSLELEAKDGKFQLVANKRNRNAASTYKKFSDGDIDILIINEAGSTGSSAHTDSSVLDKRPRAMIVCQVELDVTTEVQKRGRINRTGQVNYPTYLYVVSRVPSEIRRILMLRQKLRSLDASTTANQTQNAKVAEITDSKNQPIHDIYNKYGTELLLLWLESDGIEFQQFYCTRWGDPQLLGTIKNYQIDDFARQIEMATCNTQLHWYNEMNEHYPQMIAQKKAEGSYELETLIEDLRASVQYKRILKMGAGTNPFNTGVFVEDNFVNREVATYSKLRLESFVASLAKGAEPSNYYSDFVAKYAVKSKEYEATKLADYPPFVETDYPEDEREAELELYLEKKKKDLDELELHHKFINFIMSYPMHGTQFKPMIPVVIPENIEFARTNCSSREDLPTLGEFHKAVFCGIRKKDPSKRGKEEWASSQVIFVFAQMDGTPIIEVSAAKANKKLLQSIFWASASSMYMTAQDRSIVNMWDVKPHQKRVITRFLTGNLLDAKSIASQMGEAKNSTLTSVRFTRFTTIDSDVLKYGLKLNYSFTPSIDQLSKSLQIPLWNDSYVDAAKDPIALALQNYIRPFNAIYNSGTEAVSNEDYDQIRIHGSTGDVCVTIFAGTDSNVQKWRQKSDNDYPVWSQLSSAQKKYYSKYSYDSEMMSGVDPWSYKKLSLTDFVVGQWVMTKASRTEKQVRKRQSNLRVRYIQYRFDTRNQEGLEAFNHLRRYIFEQDGFLMNIETEKVDVTEFDLVENAKDAGEITEDAPSKAEDSDVVVKYEIESPFVEANMPPMYIKGTHAMSKFSKYGTIEINGKLPFDRCKAYGFVPIGLSPADVVKRLLEHWPEGQDKKQLKKSILDSEAGGASAKRIGLDIIIEKQKRMAIELRYTVGLGENGDEIGPEFIGTAMIDWANDRIISGQQSSVPDSEENATPRKKPSEIVFDEVETYLINLLHLLRS